MKMLERNLKSTTTTLWNLTSTSTSCSTVGADVCPCLCLPHPATVAVRPCSFRLRAGKHTGTMCCLNATTRDSFIRATSLRKSVGEYCGCTCWPKNEWFWFCLISLGVVERFDEGFGKWEGSIDWNCWELRWSFGSLVLVPRRCWVQS